MKPFPKSKAGQLADLLRARIDSSEWSERLPPERQLADEFIVSRSTLRSAIAMLEKDGLVMVGSSTRGGHLLTRTNTCRKAALKSGQIRILTPSLGDTPLLLEHIAIVRGILGKVGIAVEVRASADLASLKDPLPALRRLAASHPGDMMILHKMPYQVHLAIETLALPAVVFGSTRAGVTLPTVDINFAATAHHAVGRCLAAGRSRIALLVHRTQLAGDDIIHDEILKSTISRNLAQLRVLRHDSNRSRLIQSLDHLIDDRRDRPDVIIIVNQHHLLTTLPHLLHRGVRIPDDLALIYLGNDPVVERLSPLPDRYDTGNALPRALAKTCLTLLSGGRPPSCHLIPRSLRGETLPQPLCPRPVGPRAGSVRPMSAHWSEKRPEGGHCAALG